MTFAGLTRPVAVRLLATLALIAGVSAPLVSSLHAQDETSQRTPSSAGKSRANDLSEAFREVYRTNAPSVVNIRSVQRLAVQPPDDELQPFDPSNPLDDLFRRFQQEAPDGQREFRFGQPSIPMPRERRGEGSGVIVRNDGYIVTNNHVVEGATTIRVRLDDDREYDGTVVGVDPETDLAVIKIDANGLVPARFGDSDRMAIGDWVLALGSPLGLQHTMTAGIVSATGRGTLGLTDIGDFIQTDAAINPGNSGGPLINLDGEVIGISTAINTRTGFYMGVGFAIPSNIIKPVMNTIIEGGRVQRGWLGVEIGSLSPEAAEYAGFENTQGVLISNVLPGGPAEQAGLQPGDNVTKNTGRNVADSNELLNAIAATPPGSKLTLTVCRNGQTRDFTVTLGDRSAQQLSRGGRERETPGRPSAAPDLGVTVQELTPELARQLNATGVEGVVVTRVDGDSPAAEAGLRAGDIISMVNESQVRNVQDFTNAIRNADLGRVVRLRITRDGATVFVFVKPARS